MQCKETVKRGLSRIHKYGEGALEPLTQQCAKSADGVSGFAGKQVSAVRKF
jgi:hypothetical protein